MLEIHHSGWEPSILYKPIELFDFINMHKTCKWERTSWVILLEWPPWSWLAGYAGIHHCWAFTLSPNCPPPGKTGVDCELGEDPFESGFQKAQFLHEAEMFHPCVWLNLKKDVHFAVQPFPTNEIGHQAFCPVWGHNRPRPPPPLPPSQVPDVRCGNPHLLWNLLGTMGIGWLVFIAQSTCVWASKLCVGLSLVCCVWASKLCVGLSLVCCVWASKLCVGLSLVCCVWASKLCVGLSLVCCVWASQLCVGLSCVWASQLCVGPSLVCSVWAFQLCVVCGPLSCVWASVLCVGLSLVCCVWACVVCGPFTCVWASVLCVGLSLVCGPLICVWASVVCGPFTCVWASHLCVDLCVVCGPFTCVLCVGH